jgi:hypothetical protein
MNSIAKESLSTTLSGDTYVRTPSGWRHVFGQASLPLPNRKVKR